MSLIRLPDFKKLRNQLKEYYGQQNVNTAITSLIEFYQEEAFDTDDITNDWIPNDFKNCDGIDIFVDNLNYPPLINNENNKQILFNWFCHWLLPNVPKPLQKPIHPIADTTSGPLQQLDITEDLIDIVAKRFAIQLTVHITIFDGQIYITNSISITFIEICKDNEYTEIDQLLSDVENIDDCFIIEEIIKTYPQYHDIQEQMFNVLQDIVVMIKYDNYPPFDLKRFNWKSTRKTWERTDKLCTEEIPSFFKNNIKNPTNYSQRKPGQESKDEELMAAKALDFENDFPFLMNMIDAFARYCADENRKYWSFQCQNEGFHKAQATHESVQLKPTKWLKHYGGLYHYIRNIDRRSADCIVSAMEVMLNRPLHKFNFNYIMCATLFDSYDIFGRYLCAMNKFVYDLITPMNQNEHLPLQIDLWIIPRLTKRNVYNDPQLPDDLNEHTFEDLICIDDDETKESDWNGIVETQELAKNDNTGDAGKVWKLEDKLQQDGYVKGTDYWCYTPKVDHYDANININDNHNIRQLERNIEQLWGMNLDWQNMRYTRYILVIDRRNPKHIEEKKMADDTHKAQTWNDAMYLIRPKVKIEKSNNYDTIAKQYAFVLNETFIGNTKEYLFPLPGFGKGGYDNNLTGLDAANGYKFVVSFHIYFSNKVKMYWYYNQGAMRFFMDDIDWLWPRFFKMKDANSFQVLSDDTRIALHESVNKYTLKDLQFEEFRDQYNTFDV